MKTLYNTYNLNITIIFKNHLFNEKYNCLKVGVRLYIKSESDSNVGLFLWDPSPTSSISKSAWDFFHSDRNVLGSDPNYLVISTHNLPPLQQSTNPIPSFLLLPPTPFFSFVLSCHSPKPKHHHSYAFSFSQYTIFIQNFSSSPFTWNPIEISFSPWWNLIFFSVSWNKKLIRFLLRKIIEFLYFWDKK